MNWNAAEQMISDALKEESEKNKRQITNINALQCELEATKRELEEARKEITSLNKTLNWYRNENLMLEGKIDMVELIFGGKGRE